MSNELIKVTLRTSMAAAKELKSSPHHHLYLGIPGPSPTSEAGRVAQYLELGFSTKTFKNVKASIPAAAYELAMPEGSPVVFATQLHPHRITNVSQRFTAGSHLTTVASMIEGFLDPQDRCMITGDLMRSNIYAINLPSSADSFKAPQVFVLDWEGECPIAPQLVAPLIYYSLAGTMCAGSKLDRMVVRPLPGKKGFRLFYMYQGLPAVLSLGSGAELPPTLDMAQVRVYRRLLSALATAFVKAPVVSKWSTQIITRNMEGARLFGYGAFSSLGSACDHLEGFFPNGAFSMDAAFGSSGWNLSAVGSVDWYPPIADWALTLGHPKAKNESKSYAEYLDTLPNEGPVNAGTF